MLRFLIFQFGFAFRPRLCVLHVLDSRADVCHEGLHRGIAVALGVSQPDVQDAIEMVYVYVIYDMFIPGHHGALYDNRVEGLGFYNIRDDGIRSCHAQSTVFAS